MNKRHKHYDVILAFAEGKEIQIKYGNSNSDWRDWNSSSCPPFGGSTSYRIKPEPEPDVVVELKAYFDGETWISCDPNLILTFSGEDGRLIKAEVIGD